MLVQMPRRLIAWTRVEHLGGLVGGIGRGRLDAGVVVGQVQPTKRSHRLGHRAGDLILVGDIAAHAEHAVPSLAQLGLGRGQRIGVEIGQRDRRPSLGESPRRGQAHPRAGAGDKRDAPSEVITRVDGRSPF
jgi:hypothetical protein